MKMARSSSAILVTCLFLHVVLAGYSDFVHFENDLGDLVKPKQPLLGADRDGRFIRFETKDSEIELELGVAVPFLKIPTLLGSGDHHVTINIAGLLVGATILLTSFLLIPLVLPNHHGHSRSDSNESSIPKGAWSIVYEADELLKKHNLDVRECSRKFVCELTQTATHSVGDMLVESVVGMNAVKKVMEGINIVDAVDAGRNGRCSAAFSSCVLQLSLLPRLFST